MNNYFREPLAPPDGLNGANVRIFRLEPGEVRYFPTVLFLAAVASLAAVALGSLAVIALLVL
jgi:hypothetical protein